MFRTIDLAIPLSAALALITLTLVPSRADPTSAPDESVTGVFGEGAPTQGQPSKTGAMKWTYPFELPSARGRPQPRLSLSYDSSSHDREAGYGWGFELPVIELKPLSGNPCFESDGTPLACWKKNFPHSLEYNNEAERYAFNGEPLVFICQLPAPPENCDPNHASEPQPDWIAHGTWRYFRLQVEGEFSRFYLSEDRRYWRVQLKGGELLEFGEPPLSTGSGVEHPADNQSAVLRWRLVRELDSAHKSSEDFVNFVSYQWKTLGKRGLLYLTDIFDTPRANHHQAIPISHTIHNSLGSLRLSSKPYMQTLTGRRPI